MSAGFEAAYWTGSRTVDGIEPDALTVTLPKEDGVSFSTSKDVLFSFCKTKQGCKICSVFQLIFGTLFSHSCCSLCMRQVYKDQL